MGNTDTGGTDAGANPPSGGANGDADSGGTNGDAGESGAGGESGSAGESGAGGEGGMAFDLPTGVASGDCAARSTTNALYPLEEGAWWYHWAEEPGSPRTDKVNYVCAEQPMPRAPTMGLAFPVLSFKVGVRLKIRWQSLEPCQNGQLGYDIKRHYDEEFDLAGNRVDILHYCPPRQRTVDCRALAGELPWREHFTEATVALLTAPEGNWSDCEAIGIDPNTCEPLQDVPAGCEVTICPGNGPEDCRYLEGAPEDVYQEWFLDDEQDTPPIPAGEFDDVVVHGNDDWQGERSFFFWARGVGKVYERSMDLNPNSSGYGNVTETEELHSYCIPNGPHPEPPPFDEDLSLPDRCPTPE